MKLTFHYPFPHHLPAAFSNPVEMIAGSSIRVIDAREHTKAFFDAFANDQQLPVFARVVLENEESYSGTNNTFIPADYQGERPGVLLCVYKRFGSEIDGEIGRDYDADGFIEANGVKYHAFIIKTTSTDQTVPDIGRAHSVYAEMIPAPLRQDTVMTYIINDKTAFDSLYSRESETTLGSGTTLPHVLKMALMNSATAKLENDVADIVITTTDLSTTGNLKERTYRIFVYEDTLTSAAEQARLPADAQFRRILFENQYDRRFKAFIEKSPVTTSPFANDDEFVRNAYEMMFDIMRKERQEEADAESDRHKAELPSIVDSVEEEAMKNAIQFTEHELKAPINPTHPWDSVQVKFTLGDFVSNSSQFFVPKMRDMLASFRTAGLISDKAFALMRISARYHTLVVPDQHFATDSDFDASAYREAHFWEALLNSAGFRGLIGEAARNTPRPLTEIFDEAYAAFMVANFGYRNQSAIPAIQAEFKKLVPKGEQTSWNDTSKWVRLFNYKGDSGYATKAIFPEVVTWESVATSSLQQDSGPKKPDFNVIVGVFGYDNQ